MRATAMLILPRLRSDSRAVFYQGSGATHKAQPGPLRRRQQDVLLEPVDLLLADIFADLLVELGPGLPGPVFHQLGGHARADAGNEQELLALAGVQIDLDEGLAIELARLLGAELLVEQKLVEFQDGWKRPLLQESLHDRGRHVRERLQ